MTAPDITPATARPERGICPPDHDHAASTVCYLHHRCGCAGCREGQAQRARVRRRQIAYGTYARRRHPAGPVREYLAYLGRSGIGTRTVEQLTGVPRVTISGIRWGRIGRDGVWRPSQTVTADVASKILAVVPTLEVFADGASVNARGTVRRLQALHAIGWSFEAIGARIDRHASNVGRIVKATRVKAGTARRVAELYDELWATRPEPATPVERAMVARAVKHARLLGWVPPLAWDDIDDDDDVPTADVLEGDVDVVAVEFAVAGHRVELTRDERLIALTQLHARGYFDGDLARMLCVSSRTIERDRKHLDLPANYRADEAEIA